MRGVREGSTRSTVVHNRVSEAIALCVESWYTSCRHDEISSGLGATYWQAQLSLSSQSCRSEIKSDTR